MLIFLLLKGINLLSAQTLSIGRYSTLEKMTVARAEDGMIVYMPGVYSVLNNLNRPNKEWYHKTTLIITDTSLTVKKVPVYLDNETIISLDSNGRIYSRSIKRINYSDSSGGFYDYDVKLYPMNDTTVNLSGRLIECKYCPNSFHGSRYVRIHFVIHFNKENLTIDTDFEKGLLLKKEN